MDLLIIDAGSSSVKFRLLHDEHVLLNGQVDRVGSDAHMRVHGEEYAVAAPDARAALARIFELVTAALHGRAPEAIVHRIVHGGERDRAVILDRAVLADLAEYCALAPLHQSVQLALVRDAIRAYPRATQIGDFDTAFHAHMPAVARLYALPREIAREHRIRRYGYHGLAHEAMLIETAALMGRRPYDLRLITLQLGNGVSACSIADRHSIDTTMGFTPLEGLPMGTRSGSIDPAIVPYLCDRLQMTPDAVLQMLERESGLLGLAGSSDVRDLLAREHTDPSAKLALDLLAYHVRKAIGAAWAVLGLVDAIVLAGGIAQSPVMRRRILQGLEDFGIILQRSVNEHAAPTQLSSGDVPVFVVDGDEMEIMRRHALHTITAR